ncbi:MAG: proteasome assembly chaperone family protein [Candidatus Aenigmatarchaeota archaeon]
MKTKIKILEKIKFKNPILIEGLPGIGNVGRVAAGYLISELRMKKFAEIFSPHFLPLVLLHEDSVVTSLKCEFYYCKSKKNDIIVLTGDTQSITPEGHYEMCNKILEFVNKLGVKEIITLGGFSEGKEITDPRVICAVNDKKLIKKYEKYGINFDVEHQIGTIVGASGLLLGLGKIYNIDGLCIMGETVGFPVLTDPKAADKVLQTVVKILDIKIDLSKLENIIKIMEGQIKKADEIHKKMIQEISKPAKDEQTYIG